MDENSTQVLSSILVKRTSNIDEPNVSSHYIKGDNEIVIRKHEDPGYKEKIQSGMVKAYIKSKDQFTKKKQCLRKDRNQERVNLKNIEKFDSKSRASFKQKYHRTDVVYMERDIDLGELHKWMFVSGEEVLGEGTYGRVYKMYKADNYEIRAFKRIYLDKKGFPSWLMRELSLLSSLNHPHIIRLLQIYIGPERVYLSFPYISGGNLMDLFSSKYQNGMPVNLVKFILKQILEGLSHCHKRRIIHRDLKPDNILCKFNGFQKLETVMIADFGLARSIRWPNQTLSPEVITLYYRPIEILLGMAHYTSAVDIWSVGCILLEMFIGPMAFREVIFGKQTYNEFSLILRLLQTFGLPKLEEWPNFYELPFAASELPKFEPKKSIFEVIKEIRTDLSDADLALLEGILILNPDKRLSAAEALQNEWLKF